jgi:dTDP-4-amino-4,6-dideoxygalactose transaminase
MKYQYNPWPLGKLDKKHQRPAPDLLRERGYQWSDPRDIVDMCEEKIANFFGAKYCVTTDCCSHAIFLSLQFLLAKHELEYKDEIGIPRHTYVSVPMQILNSGLLVRWMDTEWQGHYHLIGTRVVDAAVLWQKDSYIPYSLMCLSFQIKKAIPTGKMGAILTDDPVAYRWLKIASYDGRDLTTPYDSPRHVRMIGWHMYATPEDCARTILLMDDLPERGAYMGSANYPDASLMIQNA